MSREARKQLVLQVLEANPKATAKELLLGVWKLELEGKDFNPENITRFCSSPSGIDRDRRREDVVARFPRPEKNYKAYQDYRKEFADNVKQIKRANAWDRTEFKQRSLL